VHASTHYEGELRKKKRKIAKYKKKRLKNRHRKRIHSRKTSEIGIGGKSLTLSN
jgi:hypothetical protein